VVGCLFVIFAGLFPRIAVFVIWLARPTLFLAAFGGSWLWPLLGILILPFTTLMYVLLWSPAGLAGWDWLWLVLAVILDVAVAGSSGWANRDRVPGYAGA
jgi:hypothetical protein